MGIHADIDRIQGIRTASGRCSPIVHTCRQWGPFVRHLEAVRPFPGNNPVKVLKSALVRVFDDLARRKNLDSDVSAVGLLAGLAKDTPGRDGWLERVVDGDIINLEMDAAVSAVDSTITVQNGGFAVNAFKRRETSTTVEMRDGESFAIAGLLKDDFRDLNGQVPWLGDIPILGSLFRSAEYQRDQSELVILITPHLVSPTRGEAFALPTDRVRPPSEAQLFLFGKTGATGGKGPAGEVAKQDYTSPYGYVME